MKKLKKGGWGERWGKKKKGEKKNIKNKQHELILA